MRTQFINAFKDILTEGEVALQHKTTGFLEREIEVPLIARKATVLTGIRRSGKSTVLLQALRGKKPVLHAHFFDERLRELKAEDLGSLLDAYESLHPDWDPRHPLILALDEIEVVSGWEPFVDRQLRLPGREVYLTGSSSRLLSKEIGTAMRGRSVSIEVFPFSFEEILKWEKGPLGASRTDRNRRADRFVKYLKEGGFPEAVPLPLALQKRVLQEYYEVLLLRDMIDRNSGSSVPLVRAFLRALIKQFASTFTINKTNEKLRAQGLTSDKTKVAEMLKWAEDCYLLHPVSVLAESVQRQATNPKKIYCIDTGLINAVTSGFSDNTGRLLENAVFLELRRQGRSIHYFKDKKGREVDFVVDGRRLVQVCERLDDEQTAEREFRAIESAMSELGVREATLVTLTESGERKIGRGTVHIVAAPECFLQHGLE